MLRFRAHSARTAPIMRIGPVLPLVAISAGILCAEVAAAGEPQASLDRGSWRRLVVDGGRARGLEAGRPRSTAVVPTAFSPSPSVRPFDHESDRAAWSLQLGRVAPPHAHRTYFGSNRGIPIAGDFNGDGFAELGMFIDGRWYLDLNGNSRWDDGDLELRLGATGDLPVVGDWNQDGKADIAAYTPAAEGVVPVVGDWSGSGVDSIGLYRDGVWLLDRNGDGKLTAADGLTHFGEPWDAPLVGDFNRDGRDDLGVYRRGQWILDTSGDDRIGPDDLKYSFGDGDDLPIIADWDGDGRDQIGLVHR